VEIDPGPLSFDHVKVGWVAKGWLNWSSACAENSCRPRFGRLTLDGETRMLVNVWFTVALTELVTVRPPESAMVTLKV
jgi:hypothetical protein